MEIINFKYNMTIDKKKKYNSYISNSNKFFLLIIILMFIIFEFALIKKSLNGNQYKEIYVKKKITLSSQLTNFTSYSQYYEDLFLFSIFYNVNNGFYIDIGSDSKNNYSISKAFYIRGWYGVKIDFFNNKTLFLNYRNRDINFQIINENKNNSILVYLGRSKKITKNHSNKTEIIKKIYRNYIPKHEEIYFCIIEEEGEEKNIILGIDFDNYRPKIFCIRSKNNNNNNSWEKLLLEKKYCLIYKYKINKFYIDIRIKGLREKLNQTIEYLINNYKNYYK